MDKIERWKQKGRCEAEIQRDRVPAVTWVTLIRGRGLPFDQCVSFLRQRPDLSGSAHRTYTGHGAMRTMSRAIFAHAT